jgi:hypothetical protein
MPDINWLIAAQRRFLEAMPPAMTTELRSLIFATISERLAATFPKAHAVIVRNRLQGYRSRSDRHILLVEVTHRAQARTMDPACADAATEFTFTWPEFCEPELGQQTQTTAHIVKLAFKIDGESIANDSDTLEAELNAWEKCRPVGLTHDSILMRLRPGAKAPDGRLLSIIYEDAHHVIGLGQVVSLEEAVTDCCVWGTPSVASIELLIRVLYERFGTDFYSRSGVIETPHKNLEKLQAWKCKFDKSLDAWQDKLDIGDEAQLDRLRIRREVLAILSYQRDSLIDPVDYLRSVRDCPQYCPLLLWGCSDGDLHGRNVLVSVLDDDVSLPAVYDFADMGLDNLVGWDFVKLETELKVRILPLLLNGPEAKFLSQLLQFECFLAAAANAIHDQKDVPRAEFETKGLNDLAAILVAIRRQARRHLGLQRQRDRKWLEEYYFLLACYGVYAGLFETYQSNRRQIAAAYVSAGVAARQLARPTQKLNALIRQAEVEAKRLVERPDEGFTLASYERTRDKCEMSYHERLAFARTWIESRESAYLKPAITILKCLRMDYPHVLEVEDELALAYLEDGNERAFEELLVAVNARYSQLSEEFLCRIGRFWKAKADRERTTDLAGARRSHELALDWYRKAHAIRDHYYPGVNVAALAFALGKTEQARKTAEAVLRSLEGATLAEDPVWVHATQADARLLLDHHEEAERLYRQAISLSSPRGVATMRRQVKILLAYAASPSPMSAYWTSVKLDEVFGPEIQG